MDIKNWDFEYNEEANSAIESLKSGDRGAVLWFDVEPSQGISYAIFMKHENNRLYRVTIKNLKKL